MPYLVSRHGRFYSGANHPRLTLGSASSPELAKAAPKVTVEFEKGKGHEEEVGCWSGACILRLSYLQNRMASNYRLSELIVALRSASPGPFLLRIK